MSNSPSISPTRRSDAVDIRRAADGSVASISIRGALGGAPKKMTKAFRVHETADRIELTTNPAALVTTAKFSDAGTPLVLDVRDIPATGGAGQVDGKRLVVSFQWQDGTLVGVRIE